MVEIKSVARREVWRDRGAPRREIPEAVQQLANSTYKTGVVQEVTFDPANDTDVAEVAELKTLMRSHATARKLHMRIQSRTNDETGAVRVLFEMVDKPKAKRTP